MEKDLSTLIAPRTAGNWLSLPFVENVSGVVRQDVFWRFDKKIITDLTWAGLSASAKAALPVIMRHSNKDGRAIPSQERIAEMAGVDLKSVVRGVKELQDWGPMKVETRWTKKMTRHNTYILKPGPLNRSARLFPHLFDAGIWAGLPPSSKAIFLVLLCGANIEPTDYAAICVELEDQGRHAELQHAWTEDYFNTASGFQFRQWGLFDGHAEDVMILAGIKDVRTYRKGMDGLALAGLIAMVAIGGRDRLRVQLERPMWGTVSTPSIPQ